MCHSLTGSYSYSYAVRAPVEPRVNHSVQSIKNEIMGSSPGCQRDVTVPASATATVILHTLSCLACVSLPADPVSLATHSDSICFEPSMHPAGMAGWHSAEAVVINCAPQTLAGWRCLSLLPASQPGRRLVRQRRGAVQKGGSPLQRAAMATTVQCMHACMLAYNTRTST